MKTLPRTYLILLFLALAMSGFAFAEEETPTAANEPPVSVSCLPGHLFPAKDAAALDAAMGDLFSQAKSTLPMLIAMLTPPENAADTGARYAMGGASFWVTKPGREKERTQFEKACLGGVKKEEINPEVKAFLIEMLQHAGTKHSVPVLIKLVGDERLGAPAIRALAAIGGPAAGRALAGAYKDASCCLRLALLQALSQMKYDGCLLTMSRDAASADSGLRTTARDALALIGEPGSASTLRPVLKSGKLDANETRQYLRLMDQMIQDGHRWRASWALRRLLSAPETAMDPSQRAAALNLLAGVAPKAANRFAAKTCLAKCENDEEGFVSLFNGVDLTGWVGDTANYPVTDGVIVCNGANIYTEKQYANFVFRFDFRLPKNGNNGLAVRCPMNGGAFNGMELQILDDSGDEWKDLKPYQYHGSVYGIIPAKQGSLKPVGEWNSEEVIMNGRQVKITVNGMVIVDANLDEAIANGIMDGQEHKNLNLPEGYIGFNGHGSPVAFKNIRIKTLP